MDFDSAKESSNYLLSRTKHRPKIAIICGSGLGIRTLELINEFMCKIDWFNPSYARFFCNLDFYYSRTQTKNPHSSKKHNIKPIFY